ncbi:MAG TPA: response regulator [Candidatus Limnocylindrales bacterium]|nr:response regulator [Candidatus Limnocylindrales bacterium]
MARVMIVDDSKTVRHYLSQMIELADHTAIPVESAEKAIELLEMRAKEEPVLLPDLIFMDVIMTPGMSGIEATNKIKSHSNPAIADIPIVFLTGIGEQDIASEALDAGALDYIVKPSSAESLPIFLDNLRKKLDRLLNISTRSLKKGTGLIADLSNEYLPSLLQMLHLEDASGYITLTNPKRRQSASMHMRYGNIEYIALVDTSKGVKVRLEGEEAFHMLVNWTEGIFSFGRADPERMPKGKPMNLVVLLCAIDTREIQGATKSLGSSSTPVIEPYPKFKARLEEELSQLLENSTAFQIFYIRIKDKASILLRGQKKNKSPKTQPFNPFKSEKELLTFVESKAQNFVSKLKDVFFFLQEGYLLLRKWGKSDYIVILDPDSDQSHQGRLLAAQAATIIRKAAVERRNQRLATT